MKTIDISGAWSYRLDPDDEGIAKRYYAERIVSEPFILPGTTCENKLGKKCEYADEMTKDAVRALRERYEYIGALWLQREVTVPEEFACKCVSVYLERVNIASELWLDGEKMGRQKIELSAPHEYRLPRTLTAGVHTITLRIDNRNLVNFGDMASGYSVDTQGIWCGVVGKVELRCREVVHAENVQVYPSDRGAHVKMTLTSDIKRPYERRAVTVTAEVTSPSGEMAAKISRECVLYSSRQVEEFDIVFDDADKIERWDEFTPSLYTLTVTSVCGDTCDEASVRFGMRTVCVRGKRIMINGRELSLRGTIDCAQFPLTGYPPCDAGFWRERFATFKEWGLNHVRFHAWCPPEAAFEAADEIGVYLSVEMPLWTNLDVVDVEYGDDDIHDVYYTREAKTISKRYGDHPSFVMFSNGNETMGNFELLSDITSMMRVYDPRRLYTLTSNFDHKVMMCEDYICAQDVGGRHVRIQHMHDEIAKGTYADYSDAVNECPVPIVTFEVGQYCTFPDVDICERYTGNMMPVNFDVIRKRMKKKGVYGRLGDYIAASGDLAARLYKEDIEAAMRTDGLGGFQLLSLCDYTGQNTATVGMLDVFGRDKGVIAPEAWRRFCSPVVPLWRSGRIYKNTDVCRGTMSLYDFGRERIRCPEYKVTVKNGDDVVFETSTTERDVEIPLGGIDEPSMLTVNVGVGEYENSWRIYVFPETEKRPLDVVSDADGVRAAIENGIAAVVTADAFASAFADIAGQSTLGGSYIPVFWSPVLFPTNAPSGEIIECGHPLFDGFPTGRYPDYQWKTLLDRSRAVDVSRMRGLHPIVEVVPNFADATARSPLFEVRAGGARLLVCGFDLDFDDAPTRALRECVYRYVQSETFKPKYEIVM